MTSRTIGGFLPFELPTCEGDLPLDGSMPFASGRACIRAVLEELRPARLYAPFYVCDAALAPAIAVGVPIVFYAIDGALEPEIQEAPAPNDLVLVVDYFGLKPNLYERFAYLGDRVIFDQTQAFFGTALRSSWRFTSARKWFGVPDGGFLWGPRPLPYPHPAPLRQSPTHLIQRRWGDAAEAYTAFQRSEALFRPEADPISLESRAVLAGVSATRVREIRLRNFSVLKRRLERHNQLRLTVTGETVPFCYPFLPERGLSRERLAKDGIFVPKYWNDCELRARPDFAWEMELSRRLLPLPIDHRYGTDDMLRIADAVEALLAE